MVLCFERCRHVTPSHTAPAASPSSPMLLSCHLFITVSMANLLLIIQTKIWEPSSSPPFPTQPTSNLQTNSDFSTFRTDAQADRQSPLLLQPQGPCWVSSPFPLPGLSAAPSPCELVLSVWFPFSLLFLVGCSVSKLLRTQRQAPSLSLGISHTTWALITVDCDSFHSGTIPVLNWSLARLLLGHPTGPSNPLYSKWRRASFFRCPGSSSTPTATLREWYHAGAQLRNLEVILMPPSAPSRYSYQVLFFPLPSLSPGAFLSLCYLGRSHQSTLLTAEADLPAALTSPPGLPLLCGKVYLLNVIDKFLL